MYYVTKTLQFIIQFFYTYSLSDIEKLPAIKEMIKFMWIYHHEHDDNKELINWVWANSAIVPNAYINESDFIQESFVIWPGNYWHKCVTLKFPEEWNLGTQSHVCISVFESTNFSVITTITTYTFFLPIAVTDIQLYSN